MIMSATKHSPVVRPDDVFSLRGRMVAAGVLTAFLLGGIGLWTATARIDAAIIGAGTVLVKGDIQNVQHPDGGTLKSILVKEGDRVTAGQPVLLLDTFDLDANFQIIRGQLWEVEARVARLRAERDGGDMVLPEAFVDADSEALDVFEGERRLMQENRSKREAELVALDLQADQLRFEHDGLLARKAALGEELALVQASYDRFQKLQADGAIEKSKLDDVQRQISRVRGELGEVMAGLAKTEARQSEIRLQIDRAAEAAQADAHRELRELQPRLSELRQQYLATLQKIERAVLRAPAAGIVNEVNVATIGEVVPSGKTLVTIVPDTGDLDIEFRISATDIDAIQPGQKARLRFPSFNQRLTPEIEGVVDTIGAAAVTDPQTGATYYAARAKVTGDLGELGSAGLVPGMPVEVYVPTADRVVISYLVQPVLDQMHRAMREE